MKKFFTALALLLCLSGLPTSSYAQTFDLQATVQTDHPTLEAARLDAESRGDVLAVECYAGVETYLDSHPLPNLSLPHLPGVVGAFQTTRDAVKNSQKLKAILANGTPIELEQACGPLAMDARQDVRGIVMDLSIFGVRLF